jgi:hypothetical protein
VLPKGSGKAFARLFENHVQGVDRILARRAMSGYIVFGHGKLPLVVGGAASHLCTLRCRSILMAEEIACRKWKESQATAHSPLSLCERKLPGDFDFVRVDV